jgi:hypothetical protein
MADFRATLSLIDRPHLPAQGAANIDRYKEWFHFNLLGLPGELDVIVNISLSGDVVRHDAGEVDVIVLCHRNCDGWAGGIEYYRGTAAQLDQRRLALTVSDAVALRCEEGTYHLTVQPRYDCPGMSVELYPQAEPMLLWNDTPIGSGSLNWLIAPHLEATGEIYYPTETVTFDGACAYHDHNWGYWRWGDDLGWEWGFASDMGRALGSGRLTVVFDRTTDRIGGASFEHTLAIWRDNSLLKLFTRLMLRTHRKGQFGGAISRRPGAAWLVAPGEVRSVPRIFMISARDDSDWLDVQYEVTAALQIAVPCETGFHVVGLNETFGKVHIRGSLSGQAVNFTARCCFEFLG